MNFLEKLDFLMDKYGLNKRTLSRNSDIPYTTIANWYKRGYDGLTLPTLKKIADYFNTTLDYWFLDEITDPNYGKSSGFKVEYAEMEHIKKYRDLDDHGREHVNMILEWEVQRLEALNKVHVEKSLQSAQIIELEKATRPKYFISYYQRMASAGSGEYLFDDIPTDLIEVLDTHTARRADFVIGINGRSMEPDYQDGDKVFVEKAEEIPTGSIGVFLRGNDCFIKELGIDRLISHNPDKNTYPDIPASEDMHCVGLVLGKVED